MKALSLVLLVVMLGSAGALGAWSLARDAGASAPYRVEALGPDGPVLDATVEVDDATVLSALQAAADEAGVALWLVEYPGMGTYVRSIGGHEARGANGWVYEVLREGAWMNGDRSADRYPLQNGDAVRWSWT